MMKYGFNMFAFQSQLVLPQTDVSQKRRSEQDNSLYALSIHLFLVSIRLSQQQLLPACPRAKSPPSTNPQANYDNADASKVDVSPSLRFAHPQTPLLVNLSQFFKQEFEERCPRVWDNENVSILIFKSSNVLELFQGKHTKPVKVDSVDISDLPIYDTAKATAHSSVGLFLLLQGNVDDISSARALSSNELVRIEHLRKLTEQTLLDFQSLHLNPSEVVTDTLRNDSQMAKTVLSLPSITKSQVSFFQSSLRSSMFFLLDVGAFE